MTKKRINCGRYWTVLSTMCWIRGDVCGNCPYKRYCWVKGMKFDKPIIKIVVDMLLVKHGDPPEEMIFAADDEI
jgi:hypothetical protein